MSAFTNTIAIRSKPYGQHHPSNKPPAWLPAKWELIDDVIYAVGDVNSPTEIITAPSGFIFNGHSVPVWLFFLFLPSHSSYIQSAAIHDWMYNTPEWNGTRSHADAIYYESLLVLGIPKFWAFCMWFGVRVGGSKAWDKRSSPDINVS